MKKKTYQLSDHLKFIIPSLLGLFLFLTPVVTADGFSIPIGVLANWIQNILSDYLSLIMMVIIIITAVMTLISTFSHHTAFKKTPFFQSLFGTTPFWVVTRVLAAIFAVMTYFEIGPEAVYSADTGQTLLGDGGLLHVLFSVFLFAGVLLPLLMDFGLMDFFGSLMAKIMRPLFKLPGRASIDSLASWIGDGTIGVLLSSKQYEDGFYTKREAVVVATTFSTVSITFSLVVIEEVDLGHMFIPFYLTVLIAGFIAALIMPRIPPLSRYSDTYINGEDQVLDESIPKDIKPLTYSYQQAVDRAKEQNSVYLFFKKGFQNVLDMWMGVAPIVMAFGSIALILAEYTPLFQWIGIPFIPILELMQVPEATQASQTILIGFTDMFLPAIIGSSIEAEITRFIIATLSVTQLVYLSEVGGVLLGSKIPMNIKQLFVVFLLRTLITLPVIVLIAHLIF